MFGDTYEFVKKLFSSENTEVYVVRHRLLDEDRIMKVIRRGSGRRGSLHREAEILKRLRHPGIPVLYDYGEDDMSICLIEEYVRGLSLKEYFLHYPSISIHELSYIMYKLCDIIAFLHGQPVPVLYQDLKPEHIIIRDGEPVLIDYGISAFLDAEKTCDIYGTAGYMAPEQLMGRSGPGSDIYSLGVVARFLAGHVAEKLPGRMDSQIRLAMSEDPEVRPESAMAWASFWKQYCETDERKQVLSNSRHSWKQIAVCGSRGGVGCTHIAVSLVSYLNSAGIRSFYHNGRDDAVVERIFETCREFGEKKGLIYHGSFRGLRLCKGEDADELITAGVCVKDMGNMSCPVAEADITLYVMGSSPWKRGALEEDIFSGEHCHIIVNPSMAGIGMAVARDTGKRAYGFPYDPDPFRVTGEKRKLFSRLLSGEEL